MTQPLTSTQVSARYDDKTRIAYISYSGIIGAEETDKAYDWLEDLLEQVGVETLYGQVWDFRSVREFTMENLIEARKKSRRMNLMNNTRQFPVAMVVKDAVQEALLLGLMRNSEKNERKRIVRSPQEAQEFLDTWHR